MPKTFLTFLHNDWYSSGFGSKAFLVNSIEYAVSLALDIFPGLYKGNASPNLLLQYHRDNRNHHRLSLPPVRLAYALKLFDILSDSYGNLMLFILRDTD